MKAELSKLLTLCGGRLLRKNQLDGVKSDKARPVVVICKDSTSFDQDSSNKVLTMLEKKGKVEVVNSSWILDSLCLYQLQDCKHSDYVVDL